jgi:hypothetical protein
MRPRDDTVDVHEGVTRDDVGSEGGSPGDVELEHEHGPASGSEARETVERRPEASESIRRDETGPGRRSP